MKQLARLCVLPPIFLAAVSAAWADTLVVDASGGGDFVDLQLAIDTATPGDTLVVFEGDYGACVVTKSLRIVGAGSDVVVVGQSGAFCSDVLPGLVIRDLSATDLVFVSGLSVKGHVREPIPPLGRIFVDDSEGIVFLHDLATPLPSAQCNEGYGLHLQDSDLVVATRSVFEGGNADDDGLSVIIEEPSGGAYVDRSTLWMADCSTIGGYGAFTWAEGTNGASALRLFDSTLYTARSRFVGGDAGSKLTFSHYYGGHAIVAMDSVIKNVGGPGNEVVGGDPTNTAWVAVSLGDASVAFQGPSVEVEGSIVSNSQSQWLEIGSVSPTIGLEPALASLGSAFTLDVLGAPGATAAILVSLDLASPVTTPGLDGAYLLDTALDLIFAVRLLDANGVSSIGSQLPSHPSLLGQIGFFQAMTFDGPQVAFSNPCALPILP